jgi:hypothetical protein
MKNSALFILLAVLSVNCYAQYDSDKLFYVKKAEKYRRMKNTGAILTVGGTILAVVGISTLMNATTTTTYYGSGTPATTNTGNAAGGAVAYVLGAASMGAGIPLWIVGGHARRKYERKLEAITVRLDLNQQTNGLTLRYAF